MRAEDKLRLLKRLYPKNKIIQRLCNDAIDEITDLRVDYYALICNSITDKNLLSTTSPLIYTNNSDEWLVDPETNELKP